MLTFILSLLPFVTSIIAGNSTEMTALQSHLLKDYMKSVRPGTNYSIPTRIDSSFNFVSLRSVDEMNAEFKLLGYFLIGWQDERLTWDPSSYGGITTTTFESTDIWIPYIMLGSSSSELIRLHKEMYLVTVTFEGYASWFPGDTFTCACLLDIWKYPADIQTCELDFLFWGLHKADIELVVEEKIETNVFNTPNPVWFLLDTMKAFYADCASVPTMIVTFSIERRQKYSMFNLLLPMVFISLGNVCVFLLPPDSGERIGFSITFLLAISVFITIVSDTLPQVSYPNVPLISVIVFILLVVSIAIMVCVIYSLRCHLATDNKQIPPVVRQFRKYLHRRQTKKRINMIKIQPMNHESTYEENHELPIAEIETETELTWKDVGVLLDRISFCVFMFIIILVCMTYIIIIKT